MIAKNEKCESANRGKGAGITAIAGQVLTAPVAPSRTKSNQKMFFGLTAMIRKQWDYCPRKARKGIYTGKTDERTATWFPWRRRSRLFGGKTGWFQESRMAFNNAAFSWA